MLPFKSYCTNTSRNRKFLTIQTAACKYFHWANCQDKLDSISESRSVLSCYTTGRRKKYKRPLQIKPSFSAKGHPLSLPQSP